MRVFYNYSNTNFGDHLNAWLWPRLIPSLLEQNDDRLLVGVGSLLKADLERLPGQKIIFGSGSGYGPPPTADIAGGWDVYAVRGPLTAQHYGFAPETAITDGAWLIGLLEEYAEPPEKTGGTVFVPHWTSAELGNWKRPAEMAGFEYIDPLDDGPKVLAQIAAADLAVVESLHGAIFADYFRTPWIAVSSATRVLHFKWVDWCRSLDLEYKPYPLPPSDAVDFITQGMRPAKRLPALRAFDIPPANLHTIPQAGRKRATPVYRAKNRIKGSLRKAKAGVIETARRRRDTGPLRDWNARYRVDLANYLQSLASMEPSLSSDAIRVQRIDQLVSAFERFRRDHCD